MTNEPIKKRFYFSYSKPESDFLKEHGFFYITKAIHPQTKIIFTMWDQSKELTAALKEYKQIHKKEEQLMKK